MNWRMVAVAFAILLPLAACGSGKTLVLDPADGPKRTFATVNVEAEPSTVEVPDSVRTAFESHLKKALYGEDGFAPGTDLVIRYSFIQLDKGDQFTRWLLGGIGNAGEGSLTVAVKYVDASGNEVAKIQVEGKIGSGFVGGNFDNALSSAADEIAEYTEQQFK